MNDFEGRVLMDLGVLRAQMDELMGVNQPGRLPIIEHRVAVNETNIQRTKGFLGALGLLFAVLQFVLHVVAKH